MNYYILLTLFFIILLIVLLYNLYLRQSNFIGNSEFNQYSQKIEDLKILFLKMDGCTHCIKLEKLLIDNNVHRLVTIINSDSPKINDLRKIYGEINGFPTLISEKTGKKIVGNRPDIVAIIKELS